MVIVEGGGKDFFRVRNVFVFSTRETKIKSKMNSSEAWSVWSTPAPCRSSSRHRVGHLPLAAEQRSQQPLAPLCACVNEGLGRARKQNVDSDPNLLGSSRSVS